MENHGRFIYAFFMYVFICFMSHELRIVATELTDTVSCSYVVLLKRP